MRFRILLALLSVLLLALGACSASDIDFADAPLSCEQARAEFWRRAHRMRGEDFISQTAALRVIASESIVRVACAEEAKP